MTMKKTICIIFILALLFALSSCAHDRNMLPDDNSLSDKIDNIDQISDININDRTETIDKTNEGDMGMGLVNLRDIDERTNKKVVDIILEEVNDYPHQCTRKNFIFKESISEFVLVSTSDNDTSDTSGTVAYYRLKDNPDKEDYNAVIYMYFCETKEESHMMIKDYLDSYTMMEVSSSDLEVGDFALGGIYRVDFVRGNIYIFVSGYDDVEIDKLAQEIDRQILEIIDRKE